jgi:predicted transcriptional regulator
MSVTTVRLGQGIEETLDALADKLQRSRSWLINQALREFIERQELEQIRWQETLDAMESVANGHVISGEAVHAWLRSWGTKEEVVPPRVGQ